MPWHRSLEKMQHKFEVSYKPQTAYFKKHMTTVNVNISVVTGPQSFNFDGNALNLADFKADTSRYFREYYFDISHKFNKKFKMLLGYQNINYNQRLFEIKHKAHLMFWLNVFLVKPPINSLPPNL
jgi:hypothetical protein